MIGITGMISLDSSLKEGLLLVTIWYWTLYWILLQLIWEQDLLMILILLWLLDILIVATILDIIH